MASNYCVDIFVAYFALLTIISQYTLFDFIFLKNAFVNLLANIFSFEHCTVFCVACVVK